MFCHSSGGCARHLVIDYLAHKPMSQEELTEGKNCVLLSVTWLRKSNREELIRNNHRSQRINEQNKWRPAKVIT